MKKSPAALVGIVVLVLLFAGIVYYVLGASRAAAPTTSNMGTSTPQTQSPTTVAYTCDTGSIKATFASSTASVAIALSDGRNLTLAQTVSADGARYEQGANTANDIVFWTKGDSAFLTENGKTTYGNCVAGTNTTSTNGTSTFTDQGKTFSFAYPSQFTVTGGDGSYTQDWVQNSAADGLLLAQLTVPSSYEPNTNFGEAKLTVGTSPSPGAVAQCLVAPTGLNGKTSTVTINGVTYTKITYTDVGAGQIYDTTSYRTVRNGQCYAVEYTIHSGNIQNYPTGQVTQFDETKVQTMLDGIVQSFKFL